MSVLEYLRSHYSDVRRRLNNPPIRFAPVPVVVEEPPPATEPEPVIEETAPTTVDEDDQGPRIPTVREIQMAICFHYGLSHIDMITHRRTLNLVRPRQVAMYLARNMTPRSLPEIGRMFGNRDHSTIWHGVRKIEELIAIDADIAAAVEKLRAELE